MYNVNSAKMEDKKIDDKWIHSYLKLKIIDVKYKLKEKKMLGIVQ